MIRLLDAGFTRLKKSKVFLELLLFLLICLFSIGFALFMLGVGYKDMKQYQEVIDVAQLLLNYSTMIGVVIAIFTSLFLGVEYSEGAIRNKISMGHKRTAIYLDKHNECVCLSFVYVGGGDDRNPLIWRNHSAYFDVGESIRMYPCSDCCLLKFIYVYCDDDF